MPSKYILQRLHRGEKKLQGKKIKQKATSLKTPIFWFSENWRHLGEYIYT